MIPRLDSDLFIEPAGNYDIIYGDFNSTVMDEAGGKRPYLRLTSKLPNITRSSGGEVRLKCEVAGSPLPINFLWLKNLAPLEKNARFRVRNKDYWSKLVISNLDVLDSGYYQCTASNLAGSTNTTSVLRVNPSQQQQTSSHSRNLLQKSNIGLNVLNKNKFLVEKIKNQVASSKSHHQQDNSVFEEDYYHYENYPDEMKSSNEFSMQVPNSAGGSGFIPIGAVGTSSDRWLENKTLHKGECVLYKGQSCSQFLSGKYVKILSENREEIYDIDRHLLAAMIFIRNMPNVSASCKHYSHAVACYHLFKVCDRSFDKIVSICRKDCEDLQSKECSNEMAMAAQHDLIGDGPKALLPKCNLLADAPNCINVFDIDTSNLISNKASNIETDNNDIVSSSFTSSCYDGNGRNYEGFISITKSFRHCVSWPRSSASLFNTQTYPQLKNAKYYCRNPDGRRPEPFCYTLPLNSGLGPPLVEEACAVPRCPNHKNIIQKSISSDANILNEINSSPPPLLDSLTNVWRSLSSHQWQIMAMSGLGGILFLLLLLLVCCLCCCFWRRNRKRKSASCRGASSNSGINIESASSMISSNNLKKGNLNFIRMGNGCGGSSIASSDVNGLYFHKLREETNRLRNGCDNSEVLNPLLKLNSNDQFIMQQQHLYEMQQQNYRWISTTPVGNAYSGTGSLQYQNTLQHSANNYLPSQAQQFINNNQVPPAYQQLQFTNNGSCNNSNPLSSGSQHTSTEPPAEPYQIPTIQEQQLKYDNRRVIGEDASTVLYLGEWIGGMISGAALQVAIKTIKPGVAHISIENFREELKEIGPFEHINVIRVFGVTYLSQQNISVVFDYMIHGDLHEFLKVREPRLAKNDEDERLRNAEDFLRITTQIVAGMEYLASCSYVHRDLAARNCLVGDQQIIKISDFGKMKSCYDNDYYRINPNVRVPLRWLSKEAFNETKYSQASDVHAFGVTLWEIYTYGKQPYENCLDKQVIEMIDDEIPLELPFSCPPIIYGVMIECWHPNPKRRPTFTELHQRFQKWSLSGQNQLFYNGGHTNSIHSGGSSDGATGSAALQRLTAVISKPISSYSSTKANNVQVICGSTNLINDQFGSVPSPAPNSTTNLANISTSGATQMTKLTMLSNSNSIVHSTPISHKTPPKSLNNINTGLIQHHLVSTENDNKPIYSDDDYSSNEK